MAQITRLDGFRVPLGGQEIELQQIDYEGGGMSLMRIRIREGSRFTVFDIDPSTARQWAEAMARWAATQAGPGNAGPPAADGPAGDA
jgi:hypothetical protein